MNNLGVAITGIAAAGILLSSRRWAVLSAVCGILYLTHGQSIEVAGFTIYGFRVLSLVLFVRVVARRELPAGLNSIDRVFLAAYLYFVVVFLLRADPSDDRAYQVGVAVDAFLWYFGFRALIRTIDDLVWLLRGLVLVLIPYTGLVVVETVTTHNHFATIGGVELVKAGDAWFRDGRLRALGSFGHPSLLGTTAAAFFALYLALWFSGTGRAAGLAGAALCLTIVWATNSGAPLGCVGFAVIGWVLWYLRRQMRVVRISIATALLLVGLSMTAPIWYLLARLSSVTGGDGFHRAALLDIAFQNLGRWWLAGMSAAETSTWLPYTNTLTGAVDVTNNFLVFGLTSGLGAMVLLVALVIQVFRSLGSSLAASRQDGSTTRELVLWGIGVMYATHTFSWFSIAYWDQSNLIWLLHLALASSLTQDARVPAPAAQVDEPALVAPAPPLQAGSRR
jgi:hypothetical protein